MSADKEKQESQMNEQTENAQASETTPAQLPPPAAVPDPLSQADERTWAMLAHLSILLNLITGFLGPLAALIIYLVYKDRSRYVAYQSLQAAIFQAITWIGVGLVIGAMWLVTALLSIVLVGILCIPFTLLGTIFLLIVPFASLVYGVYAGVQCSGGEDFEYWLVGDWVRSTYTGA